MQLLILPKLTVLGSLDQRITTNAAVHLRIDLVEDRVMTSVDDHEVDLRSPENVVPGAAEYHVHDAEATFS